MSGGHVFQSLSVGRNHACGLVASGAAWCWGRNTDGQLGNNSTNNPGEDTPVAVATALGFTKISAGRVHTCALTDAGKAYCWGGNLAGVLGTGDLVSSLAPVPVATALTFSELTLGFNHTCGLTPGGTAYCWGANGSADVGAGGMLGDGSYTQRLTPSVVAGNRVFTRIQAGRAFTCGMVAGGKLYCWGSNRAGQLGVGNAQILNSNQPMGVAGQP